MEIRSLFLIASGMKFWLALKQRSRERQEIFRIWGWSFSWGPADVTDMNLRLEESVRMIFVPSNSGQVLSYVSPSRFLWSVGRSRGVEHDSSSSGHSESLPAAHWLLISLVSSNSNLSRGYWGFCYCCLNGCPMMLFSLPLHPALLPHCDIKFSIFRSTQKLYLVKLNHAR